MCSSTTCTPAHSPGTCAPRNLAARTIQSYLEALGVLRDYLDDADLAETTRDDMRGFISDQVQRYAATTAAIRYRSLQQFFKWALAEDIRADNPMVGMTPPAVPREACRCPVRSRRQGAVEGVFGTQL